MPYLSSPFRRQSLWVTDESLDVSLITWVHKFRKLCCRKSSGSRVLSQSPSHWGHLSDDLWRKAPCRYLTVDTPTSPDARESFSFLPGRFAESQGATSQKSTTLRGYTTSDGIGQRSPVRMSFQITSRSRSTSASRASCSKYSNRARCWAR